MHKEFLVSFLLLARVRSGPIARVSSELPATLRSRRTNLQSGQGTIEYILLTALVVGILMTVFYGPLQRLVADYRSRQTQYSDVVGQRRIGIPLAWFGGNYADPGQTAGGANAGPGAGGDTAGEDTAGDTTAGDPGEFGDTAGGDNAGGDKGGGDNSGGDNSGADGQTAGGANGGRNGGNNAGNSLLGGDRSGRNTGGSRRRSNSGDDDEGEQETGGTGGRSGGGTGARGTVRGDGGLSDQEKAEGEEKTGDAKVTSREGGETLKRERTLFGSTQERIRQGGCANIDLKVIIQIAFVVGLLFLLGSMLFQKRDKGE